MKFLQQKREDEHEKANEILAELENITKDINRSKEEVNQANEIEREENREDNVPNILFFMKLDFIKKLIFMGKGTFADRTSECPTGINTKNRE